MSENPEALSDKLARLKATRDHIDPPDWNANARLRDEMVMLMYGNFDAILSALRAAESPARPMPQRRKKASFAARWAWRRLIERRRS
jgi:hypothetical protein